MNYQKGQEKNRMAILQDHGNQTVKLHCRPTVNCFIREFPLMMGENDNVEEKSEDNDNNRVVRTKFVLLAKQEPQFSS